MAPMRHGWSAVLAVLLLLAAAPVARAEHNRYLPTGSAALDASVGDENFVVHYRTGVTPAADAQALLADMAESHQRLVAGAGGAPNAGLNAPIDDSDSKTDVYMTRPAAEGWSTFTGGVVFRDDHGPGASYVFMTPNQQRKSIRFRAAHEYMHVIQDAYAPGNGLLTESTANWAAEFALPDIDPQDSNFRVPELPLDCSYGSFEGEECGNGYRQWPFLWRLTQLYGADVIDGLLDRMAASCPANCTPAQDRQLLEQEIAAQSGGGDTLAEVFADYARRIWDPARWRAPAVTQFPTTAMQAIHDLWGLPDHRLVKADVADTGEAGVAVDHLAAHYVLVRNDGGYLPSGPDDMLVVDVARPAGQTQPFQPLVWHADGSIQDHPPFAGGTIGFTIAADPAAIRQVLLPLVNDSPTNEGTFVSRVRRQRGTPTPPANDTPSGAVAVARNGSAATDNVYAGGRGNVDEAQGCPPVQDATRGVWFSFTPDADGMHSYDAAGSDFNAVISLYERGTGTFAGCSGTGQFTGFQRGGTTYDVYVGRWANEAGFGTQARLAVGGPDAVLPEVNVNTPAAGSLVRTRTPVFAGNASNRFGDAGSVRILLWAGGDTSGPPARTLAAPRTATSWSVTAEPLPDGVYTWRAELDGKAGTGVSAPHTFTLQGPGTGPGPTLTPPVVDDVPFVTAECRRARTSRTRAGRTLSAAKRTLRKARGAKRRRLAKARVRRAQRGVRRANVNVRRFCP